MPFPCLYRSWIYTDSRQLHTVTKPILRNGKNKLPTCTPGSTLSSAAGITKFVKKVNPPNIRQDIGQLNLQRIVRTKPLATPTTNEAANKHQNVSTKISGSHSTIQYKMTALTTIRKSKPHTTIPSLLQKSSSLGRHYSYYTVLLPYLPITILSF